MTRPFTSLQRLSRALLARGGERVRTTDWWAVIVEIAVVVLGILIAFQVNEWGEARSAGRDQQALLNRIEEEARSDGRQLARIHEQHLDSAANLRLLGDAIADDAAREKYRLLGPSGCNVLRLPAVRRQSAGAVGQAVGERTDLIADPQLRHLLRRAEAMRAFNDRQLDFFRANFLGYANAVEPHMDWRFAAGHRVSCAIDFKPSPPTLPRLPCCPRSTATSTASPVTARWRRTGCKRSPGGWRACGVGRVADEPCCPGQRHLRPSDV